MARVLPLDEVSEMLSVSHLFLEAGETLKAPESPTEAGALYCVMSGALQVLCGGEQEQWQEQEQEQEQEVGTWDCCVVTAAAGQQAYGSLGAHALTATT